MNSPSTVATGSSPRPTTGLERQALSGAEQSESPDTRRLIPRTDTVINDPRLRVARQQLGDRLVKRAVQHAQGLARNGHLDAAEVTEEVLRNLPPSASSLNSVINATGVVLHTNLGRAPLSDAAVDALVAAAGYVDVEFDLATGARAQRGRGALAAMRSRVSNAEAALVVNNGAAALVLVATALAQDREILISRGELLEIGDGFRIPDLLVSTGARLREVGTTNRTYLADYAAATGERTGFILKVHPSNFAVEGFTASVPVSELATLGVPVVADIGSGLLDAERRLPGEPDAVSSLKDGASLVIASGDKLLGGPQAGLVLGSRDVVAKLRHHPLYRALRMDKLRLAALEATLIGPDTPTQQALFCDEDTLRERAEDLVRVLAEHDVESRAVESAGLVGGGGAPGLTLRGWAVELPTSYAKALRSGRPAVVARVERERCLIDLRCVTADLDQLLIDTIVVAHRTLCD
jgi:L-seryl-tRNA(Ser) seleniumtransferase